MLKRKTVIVLGAGASREFNLPTGIELKSQLDKDLNLKFDFNRKVSGSDSLYWALAAYAKNHKINANDLYRICHRIRNTLPFFNSIDSLLDFNKNEELLVSVGKIAIINAILNAERASNLHVKHPDRDIPFGKIETWLSKLFKIIMSGAERSMEAKALENIAFISFNYDRTVEHFLKCAFEQMSQIDETSAINIVSKLTIMHPYGLIAPLPWQASTSNVSFGNEINPQILSEMGSNIKTFTERDHDKLYLNRMKNILSDANTIIFLGFGFHQQNLELLSPDKKIEEKRIYATTCGISPENTPVLATQIRHFIQSEAASSDPILNDSPCSLFIDKFSLHF